MAGAEPGIIGDEHIARFHMLDRIPVEEMLDCRRHGVDMAWRARHRLRQHAAPDVIDAGREIARFARDRAEGGAQQRLRLLLDDRDETVPHHLRADGGERTNRHENPAPRPSSISLGRLASGATFVRQSDKEQ